MFHIYTINWNDNVIVNHKFINEKMPLPKLSNIVIFSNKGSHTCQNTPHAAIFTTYVSDYFYKTFIKEIILQFHVSDLAALED